MADISVASYDVPNYRYSGSVHTLRVYCNPGFTASDNTLVPGGTVGSGQWYESISGTLVGTDMTYASFSIKSTTDGVNLQTATYRFVVTVDGVEKEDLFIDGICDFKVPSTPTSTTFAAIATYNRARVRNLNRDEFYTKDQVEARIESTTAHGTAGGVLAGTYPDPTFAVDMATQAELDAHIAAADPHPIYLTQAEGDALYSSSAPAIESYALSFDGSAMSADFGAFWTDTAVNLGNFFWEAWVKPQGTFTGYIISDGYGGNHALLFGLTGTPASYRITGNVYNGTSNTTFGSDEGPIENEWCHLAVGWDGTNIVTYYNGVPVGITAFAGPRRTQGVNGNLYIGGSDHSNFNGCISQVRGFDATNPRNSAPGNKTVTTPFVVQTVLTPNGRSGSTDVLATFLAHFFRPNPIQPDLISNVRAGLLRGLQGSFSSNASASGGQSYPTPLYVLDTTAPTYNMQSFPVQPVKTITPAAVPSGALIFDSFSRADVIAAFDNYSPATFKSIGSTEGGSLGPKAWSTGGSVGILNGKAYGRFNLRSMETVDPAVTNVKIHARRAPGTFNSGISTGIVFRYADTSNYFAAFTTGTATNNQLLSVIKKVAGVETNIVAGTVALPAAWNELIVISKADGTLQVFADATSLYSGTDAALTSNTKVGMFTYTFGYDLANRWDTFTVLPAP